MSALHISISAETIAHIGPLAVSNSMLTSVLVSAIIVALAVVVNMNLKKSGKPSKLQAFAEMLIQGLHNLCEDITGSKKKAQQFAPFVVSFFLFIIMNNWFGLLPGVGTIGFREGGSEEHAQAPFYAPAAQAATAPDTHAEVQEEGSATSVVQEDVVTQEHGTEGAAETKESIFVPYLRAGTADLNTTIALALISVLLTQYFGIAHLGISYFSKFIDFSSPIKFFVGLLETILEFAKVMSFAFRLFGNIFAGEVLLAVMMFLVPLVIPMPFYGLELFVGFIQALVFSMLSLVFFNLATLGHGEEH